jgi:ABC-type transport system substrate-binding protein
MAIDRERYGREVFGTFARTDLVTTIIQPDLYLDGLANPAFDPEAAKALLTKAGFADSRGDGVMRYADGTALSFDVIARLDDDPQLEAVLTSIVADMRQAGVVLDVRMLSADRFDAIWLDEHSFDMIAFSYSVFPGFADFDLYGSDWDVNTNVNGFNPGGYNNEAVDRAIGRALVATNDDDYRSALHAVQRAVGRDDLFGLWFGSPDELVLAQANIKGFQPNKSWQTQESPKLWIESH